MNFTPLKPGKQAGSCPPMSLFPLFYGALAFLRGFGWRAADDRPYGVYLRRVGVCYYPLGEATRAEAAAPYWSDFSAKEASCPRPKEA